MKRKILTAAVAAVMFAGLAVQPCPRIVTAQVLAASSAEQSSAPDDWVSSEEDAAPEQESGFQGQNRALDTPEVNHRKYFKRLKETLDKSQRKDQKIFEKVERNIRANPPSKPWNPFPPANGVPH